jgi:hypothetical protein
MNYPKFGNVSLGSVSGNIKLFVNEGGENNLTGIGYNNNSMTFGVNQSVFAIPEMVINQIGDVSIIGNISTGGNLVVNSTTASTSTTTGALRVTGGVGIVGNLFLGGNLITGGTTTATGLITANSGFTMGGANNITLGSGATAPTSTQLGYTITNADTTITQATTTQKIFGTLTLTAGVYIFSTQLNIFGVSAATSSDWSIYNSSTTTYLSRSAFSLLVGSEYAPCMSVGARLTGTHTIQFIGSLRTAGTTASVTTTGLYTYLSATRIA